MTLLRVIYIKYMPRIIIITTIVNYKQLNFYFDLFIYLYLRILSSFLSIIICLHFILINLLKAQYSNSDIYISIPTILLLLLFCYIFSYLCFCCLFHFYYILFRIFPYNPININWQRDFT